MAKEPIVPIEEPVIEVAPEDTVYPDGTISVGEKPGTHNISHMKNDGTTVVLKVITN